MHFSGNNFLHSNPCSARVLDEVDYYPFGMVEPGRSFIASSTYKFGFGGQEKDDEIAGKGKLNTAMFWEYDTRLGRRWNPDPVILAFMSSYVTFSNSPIVKVDPNGDSDYYTQNGKYIGSDGTTGTDIFIVTDKAMKKEIWSQTHKALKKSNYAVYSGTMKEGTFFVLPPYDQRQEIKEVLEKSDNTYTEHGGRGISGGGNFAHIRSEDGAPAGPDDDHASIMLNKNYNQSDLKDKLGEHWDRDYMVKYKWHSHPSGEWTRRTDANGEPWKNDDGTLATWMKPSEFTKYLRDLNGTSTGKTTGISSFTTGFNQGPSLVDLKNALPGVDCFAIGTKEQSVYYYNSNTSQTEGSSGKLSLSDFYQLKAKTPPPTQNSTPK